MGRVREALPAVYSPLAGYEHYYSMARSNMREHLSGDSVKLKKYLYVIRALLARKYVLEYRLPPPLPIVDLLPMFGSDHCAKTALVDLIAKKAELGELGMGEPVQVLNDFIAIELGRTHIFKETRDDRRADRLMEGLYTSTVYGPFRHDYHNPG